MPHLTFKLPGGKPVDKADTPSNNQVVTFNSGKDQYDVQSNPGGGEANTSSNSGTGEGLALAKVGVDLPFKSLIGDTEIVLTGNANDVTFSLAADIARLGTAQTWTALQTFNSGIDMNGNNIDNFGQIQADALADAIVFSPSDLHERIQSDANNQINLYIQNVLKATWGAAQMVMAYTLSIPTGQLIRLDGAGGVATMSDTSGTGTIYKVAASESHDFQINSISKFLIGTNENTSSVDITMGTGADINIAPGRTMNFDVALNQFITGLSTGILYGVPTDDVYTWDINDVTAFTISASAITLSDAVNIVLNTTTGTSFGTATTQKLSFYGVTPIVQVTQGSDLTNSVTAGGTDDTIADYSIASNYNVVRATIRDDIYQLARSVKIIQDGLRDYGLLS